MSSIIAVDLGGTHLRVGVVSAEGEVQFVQKFPAGSKRKTNEILQEIAEKIVGVGSKIGWKQVSGLALGVPGIVETRTGTVYRSPHFPDWKSVPVGDYFREKFSTFVVVDNDAHMAARGEGWRGAAQNKQNFLLLTLGTGVGGAIVWQGKVVSGDSGFAGEFGHLVIETEGPDCNCGSQGCFEMYVSATGIRRLIEEGREIDPGGREALLEKTGGLEKMTVEEIYHLAAEGDICAHSIFKRVGYYLGIGIASLVNVTGIETVVIGGGVAQAWDFFIEPAKKELAERTYAETARRVQILRAELGDNAGLIGGAAAIRNIPLPQSS